MFEKSYLRINEAADILGIDIDTIFSLEALGNAAIHFVPVNDFQLNFLDNNLSKEDVEDSLRDLILDLISSLSKKEIEDYILSEIKKHIIVDENLRKKIRQDLAILFRFRDDSKSQIIVDLMYNTNYFKEKNRRFYFVLYHPYQLLPMKNPRLLLNAKEIALTGILLEDKKEIIPVQKNITIPIENVVILNSEFERLKRLKLELSSEPTYEQLQTENEVLKQRIAALEAKQSQQPLREDSKTTVNAFFKAIAVVYPNFKSQVVADKSEELGNRISYQTIRKYLTEGI